MTIYDISKKAGVSIATVSRVLNDSSNVRPETKTKVLDVIDKYGYTPNAFARGLGLNSMNTIGILCADSSDLFLAKAVYYLEQELQAQNYDALLCCTGYNLDQRKNYLNLLLSKKVDSIILVGSNFIGTGDEENQYIIDASREVPIMLLNAAFDYPNVYSILCDDYSSMIDATTSMINADINNILYLYNSKSYSGLKKLSGFKTALKNNGRPIIDEYIRFFPSNSEDINGIANFIQSLDDDGLQFDGIIASDDSLALGALKYAKRNDINVPSQLSIIGYNDSMLSSCCEPELTSVNNRLETLSHQVIKILMGVLDGEELPKKSIFSGKLIKRDTTLF